MVPWLKAGVSRKASSRCGPNGSKTKAVCTPFGPYIWKWSSSPLKHVELGGRAREELDGAGRLVASF